MKTKPKFYPIFISLEGKKCLIIGGGEVAFRKIKNIMPYSPVITVISPHIIPKIFDLADEKKISVINREIHDDDIREYDIIFAATNNPSVNHRISEIAGRLKIPINAVDDPQNCSFIIPAVVKRGLLTIAVSTDGAFPTLSKKIKSDLEKIYGDEYTQYIQLLSSLREITIDSVSDEQKKKEILDSVLTDDLLTTLKTKGYAAAFDEGKKMINSFLKR